MEITNLTNAVIAFVIGYISPIFNDFLKDFIIRKILTGQNSTVFVTTVALLLSLSISSAGLIFLSKMSVGSARIIALGFIFGFGAARWFRNKLYS